MRERRDSFEEFDEDVLCDVMRPENSSRSRAS